VFYISYDGMGEPLGRSQVLAYLFRLATTHEITLFSFEKPDADTQSLARELAEQGIDWRPLRYHKRPPVLSTLLDVLRGSRAVRAAARKQRPDIIHVRSYVPALIARWAKQQPHAKLVFDIRGFWADERIEGGIWPQSRWLYRGLYRTAKRCERRFFAEADAVVTLTEASVPVIRSWSKREDLDVTVIPTCVDLTRFPHTEPRAQGPVLIWCGSIGTWYRFDLVPPLADRLKLPLHVITRQTELAAATLRGAAAKIAALPPDQVPEELRAGDVGLSLCVSSFSKTASAPTRFAEYLAAGMPVIVNAGVGDLVSIVESYRVGVVVDGEDAASIDLAAQSVVRLLSDPALANRCREVARELFDVEAGSRRYSEIYSRLLAT
jgi:glycosyltransferase involved in cell wall biosynthesis